MLVTALTTVSNRRWEERHRELEAPELAPPVFPCLGLSTVSSCSQLQVSAVTLKDGFCFFLQKPKSCSWFPAGLGLGGSCPLRGWGRQGWDQNCCSGSSAHPAENSLSVGVSDRIEGVINRIFVSFWLRQCIS